MRKFVFVCAYTFIFFLSQINFALGKSAPAQGKKGAFNKEAFIKSAETNKILKIGLVDCVTYALKNNSEINIKRIEPKLKKEDIKIAKADFEPTLNVDFNVSDNEEPVANTLLSGGAASSLTKDVDINAGVEGRLITGTRYDLEFLSKRHRTNSRYQQINPSYEVEPKITITQPLFGEYGVFINRADIVIAKNDKEISEKDFKETVMNIITETKTAYYNYFYRRESYAIAQLASKRARDLLDINKTRYAKGLLSSVDLLETETAVLQKEKALIAAESDLKKAEDELKVITNLVDNPEMWNTELELIDKPKLDKREINLVESLQNAFQYRPDYESSKIDLKNRDIKIKVAKNDALPTVDLTGSFGLNGLGEDYQNGIDRISTEYKDWGVGVAFSMPWGAGDRAQYDQRKLEKAQGLIAFYRLEQDIILEVRDYVRAVDIQSRQLEVAKLAREKETKNYEAQKERYTAGQVSTHDILDYQDRLAQAELDYVKASIDYNTAIINLDKAEGLTLARNDIILEE